MAPNLAVELELARTLVLARRDHLANDRLSVVLRNSGRFRIKVKRVFKDGQGFVLRYEFVLRRVRHPHIFRGEREHHAVRTCGPKLVL